MELHEMLSAKLGLNSSYRSEFLPPSLLKNRTVTSLKCRRFSIQSLISQEGEGPTRSDVPHNGPNEPYNILKNGKIPSAVLKETPLVPKNNRRAQKLSKSALKEKAKVLLVRRSNAACYGCGTILQTEEEAAPGFVNPDTYAIKRQHRQLHTVLCGRCRQLAQGAMIPAVGGNGGYGSGRGFVTAEQLREQLAFLSLQKAVVVKLVDIVDFSGSFLNRVRDLVGSNPIILVITKVDLLPEGTDLGAVGDWVLEAVIKKRLNVLSVHLTSAKAQTGISSVAAVIAKERQGRDVYVVGAANVGKSAFIAALLEDMAKRDFFASAARKRKPIASAMPGTTLGPIPIRAFPGTSSLYDTAGVHLHHRMPSVVQPLELPLLAPKRRLRGYVPSLPPAADSWQNLTSAEFGESSDTESDDDSSMSEVEQGRGMEGSTLFWGGLVRVDVLQAPSSVLFTFFGATGVRVRACPTTDATAYYQDNIGRGLTPPTEQGLSPAWEGLPQTKEFVTQTYPGLRPSCDIAVSGLGWINVSGMSKNDPLYDVGKSAKDQVHDVCFKVHVPRGVEVFVRGAMPVGDNGGKWYKYAELSEEEEMSRPQLFV